MLENPQVAKGEPSCTAGRILWVDIFKGLLILLVIVGHAIVGVMADSTFARSPQLPSLMYVRKLLYCFHMPGFFVAAGFFARGLWRKHAGQQLLGKVDRLVRPYFVWSFILACAMQVMSGHTNNGLGIADFLVSYRVPFSQYWFLYVLFVVFCVHLLLGVLLRRWADYALLLLGAVLYGATPLLPDAWVLIDVASFTVYYAAGMFAFSLFKRCAEGEGAIARHVALAIVCAVLLLWTYSLLGWAQAKGDYVERWWMLLIAAFGIVLVYECAVVASGCLRPLARRLASLGKESMALYVMHPLFVQGTRIALVRLMHVDNPWLVAAVATIVGTAVCFVIVRLLRGTRAYRWLF